MPGVGRSPPVSTHAPRAEGLVPGKKHLDHDEFITHEKISLKNAETLVRKNRIQDGKTIAGILWALHFKR